jgi:hypothetical protein
MAERKQLLKKKSEAAPRAVGPPATTGPHVASVADRVPPTHAGLDVAFGRPSAGGGLQ